MTNKPTHTAYIVTEPKEGMDRKAQWHEIGAVWPHRNGKGFDLVIPAGLSVTPSDMCAPPRKNWKRCRRNSRNSSARCSSPPTGQCTCPTTA